MADTGNPTATEISGGTNLTAWLRQDGLKRSVVGSTILVEDASSDFDGHDIGHLDCALWMVFYRDAVSASDTAWTTMPEETAGFLIVAPFGFSGAGTGTNKAPADGDRCEVWPFEVVTRSPDDVGKDLAQLFTVVCAVTQPPNLSAVVNGTAGLFPSSSVFPSSSLYPIGA